MTAPEYKYKCDICGRPLKKKIRMYGYTLCSKHMHQLLKYGHPVDKNPRTNKDLNEYRFIDKNTVEFDTYNQKNDLSGHFLIDSDDLQKVKYYKWRLDGCNHIVTGNCTTTRPRKELSRLVMNCNNPDMVVDHINGDPTDNRKKNLRICTQGENVLNKHFMSDNHSGMIGISWDKHRNKWAPEIRVGYKRWHLGRYADKKEAIYVRWYAEKILFKDFQSSNTKNLNFDDISEHRKKELQKYVKNKLGNQLC